MSGITSAPFITQARAAAKSRDNSAPRAKKRGHAEQAPIIAQPIAFSIERAAQMLDTSRRTLYLEIAAGRLRCVKLGRSSLVLRDDLTAFAQSLPTLVLK